ncbi:MAG TPA: hypothetical protein VHC69_16620 [Polyangiaceae bacterium]|nr:hypothetical protein [Polyangiaceae bacterium]
MSNPELGVAQRRRLVEVWRTSAPSNEEIAQFRARIRRAPRGSRRSRGKVVIVALVQGLFFGGATLAAAAWIAGKALPHSTAPRAAVPVVRSAATGPARSPAQAAPELPPVPPSTPTASFEDVDRASPIAESATKAPGAQQPGRGGSSRRARVASIPTPSAEAAPASSAEATDVSVSSAGPWARVAQALSESDFAAANGALDEIATSADPATRDAAELTRAELSITRGDGSSARPVVERLARSGATGLIRKRATALLQRLPSR